MFGKKIYKNAMEEYVETAIWCNSNNCHIEDKGDFYEVVKNETYTLSKEDRLLVLEAKYQMSRVIREGILNNRKSYSTYNINKAEEIEALAEEVRKEKQSKK